MKTALVKLLTKYRLVATEETELKLNKGEWFFIIYPEMRVKLEERE